jgi:adenylate kinase family enzyme
MPDVILIGPSGTGKTTQGNLLAERLGLPLVALDDLRWTYYAETSYDADYARELRTTQGFPAVVKYWQQFDAHIVERVLADHPNSIISFGAGHSIYDDEAQFNRVQQALAPYKYVVLILPSADPEESIRILTERQQTQAPPADLPIIADLIRHQVTSACNTRLAKQIVYTQGKTPEATCAEIMRYIE